MFTLLQPYCLVLHALEVLPVALPPPPRQLTQEETQRLEEQEEGTLRELRLFLRDVTNRLSQDKRFKAFTKPVDLEEVVVHLQPTHFQLIKLDCWAPAIAHTNVCLFPEVFSILVSCHVS